MAQTFGFLLIPGFSMMGLMAAIEPLRVANRFQQGLYRWHLLSQDGQAVEASNGMSLNVDAPLQLPAQTELLFVVAGFEPLAHFNSRLSHWLHRCEREVSALGAIDTGSYLLAEAGLYSTQRLTLHWEAQEAFRERYPRLQVTQELFEIDQRRITSAGGTSSLDLMLDLISQRHGHSLAAQVSEQFVLSRIRTRQDHQRLQIANRYGLSNKKLVKVIGDMEQHCEQLLSCEALAARIGVTARQLERLFRHHLDTTPTLFYLNLRLDKARQLLRQSDLSVLDVSLACGFDSPSYFSARYRRRFGASPRNDRHEPAQAAPAAAGPAYPPATCT